MGPSDDKSPLQGVQELLGVISAGLGTALDIKSLLGGLGVGLAAAAGWQSHNVRPVVRLYDRLLEEAGPLVGARVKMSTNPYRALHQEKALILQGRNKEGKTTLLCTALPWYHRRGPWAYYGLYFNGGHGNAVSNFEKWHTVQLLGNLNMGGSETQYAINTYREKQHLRVFLHGSWPAPRPEAVLRHRGSVRGASEAISGRCVEMGELPNQHSGSRRQREGDLRCQLPRRCPDAPQP